MNQVFIQVFIQGLKSWLNSLPINMRLISCVPAPTVYNLESRKNLPIGYSAVYLDVEITITDVDKPLM